jgi:hypothetical protein
MAAGLVLALPGAADEGAGGEDAGDDLETAAEIGVGTWNGTIFRNATDEDVADHYVFAFEPGTTVTADVSLSATSSTHLDVHYKVYDRDQAEVTTMEFPRLGMPVPFAALTNDEVMDPVYYLAVTWDGSSILDYWVNYTLTVRTSGTVQNDTGSGMDAPRTRELAFPLTEGAYNGSVGGIDLDWLEDANIDGGDMYSIDPEELMFLRVEITLDRASILRNRNLGMALENSTGGVVDYVEVGTEGQTVSIRYFPPTLETLFVNITTSASINNYTLRVVYEVPGADGEGIVDAGEDPDHAMDLDDSVMSGIIMRGHGAEDLADYFEMEFTSSQFIEATLTLTSGTASASSIYFRVLDYTKVEVVNYTFSGLGESRRFAALANSEHTTLRYYFAVTWEGAEEGDYQFRYQLTTSVGPTQNDMGTGRDVTNGTSGSPTVSLETPVTGSVGGTNPQWGHDNNVDGADVYEVLPTADMFVVVSGSLDAFFAKRRVGFDVQVEDQSGDLLLKPQSVFEVGDELEMRLFTDTALPIYIRVSSESEMCNYTLLVSLEAPPDVDLYVGNVSLTPSRPDPGNEATITVVVSSTALINPSTLIRVEVFAGGNKLDHADVIFDNSDQELVTFPWTVPSIDTDLTVHIDTLNAIPWEPKDNNAETFPVEVGPEDGDNGDGDGDIMSTFFWIIVLVGVVIVAIIFAVLFVAARGQDSEVEEEDY